MDKKQREYINRALQSLCVIYEEGAHLNSELMQLLEDTIENVKIVAKSNKVTLDNETDTALRKYFILKGFSKLPKEQQQMLIQHMEGEGSLIKGLV